MTEDEETKSFVFSETINTLMIGFCNFICKTNFHFDFNMYLNL